MRASTVVQQLCKSCRTCFMFYCMFYFTCDRSFTPQYLGPLDHVADLPGRRALRSSDTSRLVVTPARLSTVANQAFPVVGPRIWNDLPVDVTSAESLSTFPQRRKPIFLLDPETGPQWLRTLLLLLLLLGLFSNFQCTKAFLFHNRSSLMFAYRLRTIVSTIAPSDIGRHLANRNELHVSESDSCALLFLLKSYPTIFWTLTNVSIEVYLGPSTSVW